MDKEAESEDEPCEKNKEELTVMVDDGVKTSGEELSIFGKSANEKKYRHQIVYSVCVCFCTFSRGLMVSMVGPTFPDLRLIIKEDLSTSSWLLTAIFLGGIFGALCGGFSYDRFNKMVVFISVMVGLGISAGITPLCTQFAAMISALFFHGAFGNAVDTVATADMNMIWRRRSGPFLQALHCATSVGYLLSPLMSKPFLAVEESTGNNTPISKQYNSSDISPEWYINYSDVMNDSVILSVHTTDISYGKTSIFIPYMIGGFTCILAIFLYLLVRCLYGNVYLSPLHLNNDSKNSLTQKKYFLSNRMKIVFTFILAVILTIQLMIETSLIGFLMTFVITELGWNKAEGAILTSTLWIAFAVGRIFCILVVKYLNLSKVLITFYIIFNAGTILFWISATYGLKISVWISAALIGFGMSIIIASGFSWVSENVRTLTGKVSSILFTSMTIGAMINPVILGNLMDKYTQMWMIYWIFIMCSSSLILFIFAYVLFKFLKCRALSNRAREPGLKLRQKQVQTR